MSQTGTADQLEPANSNADRVSDRAVGFLAIGALLLCWGAVPVLLRSISQHTTLDAWTTNGFRYPFSALLYWPVLFFFFRQKRLSRSMLGRCLVPALFSFAGQVFWALAPYYLSAGAVGFLVRSSLIFSLIGAAILFSDERRLLAHPRFYGGLIVTLIGFVVFSLARGPLDLNVTGTGIAVILLCALFFGCYVVSVKVYLNDVNPLLSFGIVAQYVSILLLIAMSIFGDPSQLLTVNMRGKVELVVSSLLGITFGHLFLYAAISKLGPSMTTSIQSMVPFATAGMAMIYLGEQLTKWQWIAGVMMVIGVLILSGAKRK